MARAVRDRWVWLKLLAAGGLLFLLVERAYAGTGSISYLPSLLVIGATTVPLGFCAFLYSRGQIPQVSWLTLLLCASWGGFLGTVLAGWLEYSTLTNLGALPMLAVGLIEEVAKMVVPAILFFMGRYRGGYDGIVIGATAGMGFAVLESMGYGLIALLLTGGNVTYTSQLLLLRGLMTPAAHIAWTGLIAGALWQTRDQTVPHRYRKLIVTFTGVVLLHALWDSMGSITGYLFLGLISLLWLFTHIRRAENRNKATMAAENLGDAQRSVNPRFVEP